MVQYFRNPIDLLTAGHRRGADGRARAQPGPLARQPQHPEPGRSTKTVTFLRETAQSLAAAPRRGDRSLREYPAAGRYFNLNPPVVSTQLHAAVVARPSCTAAAMRRELAVATRRWTASCSAGHSWPPRALAGSAACRCRHRRRKTAGLPRIAEIKIYVDRDDATARKSCRQAVGGTDSRTVPTRLHDEEYTRLGFRGRHRAALRPSGAGLRARAGRPGDRSDGRRAVRRRRSRHAAAISSRKWPASRRARLPAVHVLGAGRRRPGHRAAVRRRPAVSWGRGK